MSRKENLQMLLAHIEQHWGLFKIKPAPSQRVLINKSLINYFTQEKNCPKEIVGPAIYIVYKIYFDNCQHIVTLC